MPGARINAEPPGGSFVGSPRPENPETLVEESGVPRIFWNVGSAAEIVAKGWGFHLGRSTWVLGWGQGSSNDFKGGSAALAEGLELASPCED